MILLESQETFDSVPDMVCVRTNFHHIPAVLSARGPGIPEAHKKSLPVKKLHGQRKIELRCNYFPKGRPSATQVFVPPKMLLEV